MSPREDFLELCRRGDRTGLANYTLKLPLFQEKLKRAAAFLLGQLDPAARAEIEGIAKTSIGLRLWRTCGADYKDEDDASFEVFLKRTCLYNVRWARMKWYRDRRSAHRHRPLPSEMPAAEVVPEGLFLRASRLFESIIPTLPCHLRIPLVHRLEGRSIQETAKLLDCCEKSVRTYREQAFERLRAALEQQGLV